jgi:DNA-binding NarL/FixJ family response regulator
MLEERDPYFALNARANLAFSEGLLGADRIGQLEGVSVSASRAGVHFVRLKAVLYAAVLSASLDDMRSAVRLLGECLPEQLQLGHVNLVTQELGSRPHVAVLVLRDRSLEALAPPLLSALSRHWDFRRTSPELIDGCPSQIRPLMKRLLQPASPDRRDERKTPKESHGAFLNTPSLLDDLTPRELAVLKLMAANRSNTEIAEELFIAVSTVKTHVNHILTKLQQTNRIGAVLEYQRRKGPLNDSDISGRTGTDISTRQVSQNPPQV